MAKPTYEDFVTEQLTQGRGTGEIVLRGISIQVATMASYGHLNSLRQLPDSEQKARFLCFMCFPLYPAAESLMDCFQTVQKARTIRQPFPTWHYYLACALGCSATPDGRDVPSTDAPVPLLQLDPHPLVLRRHSEPRKMKWLGRLVPVVYLVAAHIGLLLNYFRRPSNNALISDWRPNFTASGRLSGRRAVSGIDHFNVAYALGGLFTGLMNVVLTFCNGGWSYSSPHRSSDGRDRAHKGPLGIGLLSLPLCWPEISLSVALCSCLAMLRGLAFRCLEVAWYDPFRRFTGLEKTSTLTPYLAMWPLSFLTYIPLSLASRVLHGNRVLGSHHEYIWRSVLAWAILLQSATFGGLAMDISRAVACWRRRDRILDDPGADLGWCNPFVLRRDPNDGQVWSL